MALFSVGRRTLEGLTLKRNLKYLLTFATAQVIYSTRVGVNGGMKKRSGEILEALVAVLCEPQIHLLYACTA